MNVWCDVGKVKFTSFGVLNLRRKILIRFYPHFKKLHCLFSYIGTYTTPNSVQMFNHTIIIQFLYFPSDDMKVAKLVLNFGLQKREKLQNFLRDTKHSMNSSHRDVK